MKIKINAFIFFMAFVIPTSEGYFTTKYKFNLDYENRIF